MAFDVGTAFLHIVPSFRDIEGSLGAGVRRIAQTLEGAVGDSLEKGFTRAGKDAEKAATGAGRRTGATFGGSLAKELQIAMKAAADGLPTLKPGVEAGPFDAAVARMRQQIEALAKAHVELEVDDAHVIGQLRGIGRELRTVQQAAKRDIDVAFNTKGAADILDSVDELERTGKRRGFEAGGVFADSFVRRVTGAFGAVQDIEITPELDQAHPLAQLAQLRERLRSLLHTRVGVDMDANEAFDTLADLEQQFDQLARTAASPQVRKDADKARAELAKFFADVRTEEQQAADEANAKAAKQAIADAEKQARARQQLFQKSFALEHQERVRAIEATAKLDEQAAQRRLQLFQTSFALEHRERVRADALREREERVSAERSAREQLAAFERTFAGRLPKMMRDALPLLGTTVVVTASTDPAKRELADLQQRMRALGDAEIGVNLNARDAQAELGAIRRELQQLARSSPHIDIRTNALAALAQIKAVEGAGDSATRELLGIGQAAEFGKSRLTLMVTGALGTLPLIAPVAAAAAAGIGFIGTAAGAAALGLGVFGLGLSGVTDAVKALNTAQQDAAKTSKAYGAANTAAANAADGVRTAATGLADARESAADAAISAAGRVADAERALSRARADAGRAAADAAQRTADAEQAVVVARREGGRAAQAAAAQLADAQRDLTRAEGDARDVRRELNEAIREAKRDMVDLGLEIEKNNLGQRDATTAIMEERAKLDKLLSNPRATEIEKRNAQEAYDARVLQLKGLRVEARRLAQEQATYADKGVEANDKVITARERIRDAERRVADEQRDLATARQRAADVAVESAERITRAQDAVGKAQEAARRSAVDGAERIGAAERGVADARRAQVAQQRQGVRQVAAAQQALVSAQRSQQQALLAQTAAGGAAAEKLRESMANLSPAGREFATFIFGLKDDVKSLRDAAQEGLLPGLQDAIRGLLPHLPKLRDFIRETGEAMGAMFRQMVRGLDNPTWQKFFAYFRDNAVPTMQLLFDATGNVATGFADIFLALTPFNADVGRGLLDLTEGFAKWARELTQGTGYQDFLAYVRDVGPDVVDVFLGIGEFAGRMVVALAPYGEVLAALFKAIVDGLNAIDPALLTALATSLALLATAMLAVGVATKAAKGLRAFNTNLMDLGRAGKQKGGNAIDAVRTSVDDLGRSLTGARNPTQRMTGDMNTFRRSLDGGTGKGGVVAGARGAGGALLVLSVAAPALAGLVPDHLPKNMAQFTAELAEFGRTGKPTGQVAEQFGKDFGGLTSALETFANKGAAGWMNTNVGNPVRGFFEDIFDLALPMEKFTGTMAHSKKQMEVFDQGLSTLVANGQGEEAAKAFDRMAQKGRDAGLSTEKLRELLPGYAEAQTLATQAAKDAAGPLDTLGTETDEAAAATGRIAAIEGVLNQQHRPTFAMREALTQAYDRNQTKIDALKGVVDAFTTSEGNAAVKADALRALIDAQTGAFINANEQKEAYKATMDNLRGVVESNAKALLGHKDKLDINTEAGRSNRDAIEEVAGKIREMYLQDIASEVPMKEATERHQKRIVELRKEADKLGLTSRETDILITNYGDIPQEVKTNYNTGNAFKKAFDELSRLNYMQGLVAEGVTDPAEAERRWKAKRWQDENPTFQRPGVPMKAAGGEIHGPGTKTSDSVPILASRGEFMQQAAAVDYYGTAFMAALNKRRIPREVLPGFAAGGPVGKRRKFQQVPTVDQPRHIKQAASTAQAGTMTLNSKINLEDVWAPTLKQAQQVVLDQMMDQTVGTDPGGGTAVGSLKVARIAEATARSMRASNKQLLALIEAGIVESGMRNLNYGDRDSLGFLQQRASWGSVKQRTNVEYATRAFIRAAKRKDRKNQTAGQLAQAVQVSAYPDRYDQREADAYAVLNREAPYVSTGAATGSGKTAWLMATLREVFPGLNLNSGFRRNSRTKSRRLSRHALDLAVDVPPRRKVAEWLARNYPQSHELITPWRALNRYRGKPHRYDAETERGHKDHIHWALFDDGGILPPGVSSVVNNTGKPEAVFTNEQLGDIRALVDLQRGAGGGPRAVYNVQFANTTLTPAALQAMQQREDALARVTRPNI